MNRKTDRESTEGREQEREGDAEMPPLLSLSVSSLSCRTLGHFFAHVNQNNEMYERLRGQRTEYWPCPPVEA